MVKVLIAIAATMMVSGCLATREPNASALPSVQSDSSILRYTPGDGNIAFRQLDPDGRITIRRCSPHELLNEMETRVFPVKHLQTPATVRVERGYGGPQSVPLQEVSLQIKQWELSQCVEAMLTRDLRSRILSTWNYDPESASFIVRDRKDVLNRLEELFEILDVDPERVKTKVECVTLRFGQVGNVLQEARTELASTKARSDQRERLRPVLCRLRDELNRVHDNPALRD